MKTDSRTEEHFFHKKRHTEIKHAIFQEVFKRSLYVANMHVRQNGEVYTYIDLFAGRGEFEDEAEGSPMLAFDIIEKHLLNSEGGGRNRFSRACVVAIERDGDAAVHLQDTLRRRVHISPAINRGLAAYTGDRNWETYDSEIAQMLSSSKWGFVFADPFSTELDVSKLLRTLEACKAYKDILVFANYSTLSRQSGRRQGGDIDRVCRSLGASSEEIPHRSREFHPFFVKKLKEAFSTFKEFVVGVAIPVTVEKKLIRADYFYLVLATDSIAIVDCFLNIYHEMMMRERRSGIAGNLFAADTQILQAFTQSNTEVLSLRDILSYNWDNFLSWKKAVTGPGYEIPTIENIVEKLNLLRERRRVEFEDCEVFRYATSRKGRVGDLRYTAIHNGRDARQIKVRLREQR